MSRALRAVSVLCVALVLGAGCGRTKPSVDAADARPEDTVGEEDGAAPPPDAVSEGVDARDASAPDAMATGDAADVSSPTGGDAAIASDAPLDVHADAVLDVVTAEAGADGAFVSGPHPALPQVRNQGGPVLAHPVFTAITYDGYDLRAVVEDVVATIGASDYWKATTAEYGVGAATARPPIRLPEAAPSAIDDFQIQTWLAGRLDGTHPEYGTPTQDSVYVIYYPTGTTVTNATLASCVAFGGYHSSVWLPQGGAAGTNVAYVVVPECVGTAGTTISTEASTSHELVEAATDPFGTTKNPGVAWSDVGAEHLVWQALLGGGEVTDLCQLLYASVIVPFPYPHAVQRSWSNAAARAGHDPCAPGTPGEVYFAAAGVLPDTVTFHFGGVDHATKGVRIAVGASRTIDVQLWSDAPPVLGPWTVSATDMSPLLGGPSGSLAFSWDATTGTNGTTLHLTITVLKAAGLAGGQPFMITSAAGPRHEWFGFVGQN